MKACSKPIRSINTFPLIALLGLLLAALPRLASAAVFNVLNNNDAGANSLRSAINQANAGGGPHTINFNIGGGGPQTIALASPLPTVFFQVRIDGTTQPGWAGTPIIELNGAGAGAADGLTITAGDCHILGLVINRFTGNGLHLDIGGGNIIEGNFIGTDPAGTAALANTLNGILIFHSPDNVIGGTTGPRRNVISGNNQNGVRIETAASTGNQVLGNLIGTDVGGMVALGNGLDGVLILGAPNNVIGVPVAGGRNAICANGGSGIRIDGPAATGNRVRNNAIGTDPFGMLLNLGNALHGVHIVNNANVNAIGGTAAGEANAIFFNQNDGIFVQSGVNNPLRHNAIGGNGGLGIDLAPNGVTMNDNCDGDAGPNDLQNFPLLTAAIRNPASGQTRVRGTLDSLPNAYNIDFFWSPVCDPSGNGEGEVYFGSVARMTLANCMAEFNVVFPVLIPAGVVVTATATDAARNTSEFSPCLLAIDGVVVGADLAPAVVVAPAPVTDTSNFTYSVTVTNKGGGEATATMLTLPLPTGLAFASATASQGSCSNSPSGVQCSLGTLPPGGTALVEIVLSANYAQIAAALAAPEMQETIEVTNTVTVTAAEADETPADNSQAVVVAVLPLRDFGDAPNPTFPTLLANNGPRHRIVAGFFLGAAIDREGNGQPNALADGDDTTGTDDEDGVIIGGMLPGLLATATITASANGFVDAWVDFNRDGDWNDAGENIFVALPVAAGTFGYNFPVPATAVPGNAYVRFRFSDVGGLPYTGYYWKGEVEDFTGAIAPPADLAARVTANPSPAIEGDTVVFIITVTNRGTSTATGVTVTNKLPAGITGGQEGEQVIALGNLAPGATATATVTGLVSNVQFANAEGVTVTNNTSVGAANLVAPVVIVVPVPLFVQRDFGDAPDPTFPTLLINNGARHRKVAGFHLGATIDREPNGQPTPLADGDDLAGTDDEDGVNVGAMVPGLMATVNIAASAAGFVDAWIDFNRDGDWNDAGEQIFNALPVAAGVFGYNFPVPPTAVAGNAVARFRFSDVGGLAYTGYYQKGEVEDYGSFPISPVADLAAAVAFNPSPAIEGDTVVFIITVTNRGTSTATGVTVTNKLPAGITGGQEGEQVIALGDLAPGTTATATFIGLVSAVPFGSAEGVIVTNKTSVGAANLVMPVVIVVVVPVFVQRDFGDAPDPTFPTLFFNNGARHRIVAGFHLGATIDREPNGQPTPLADGDDLAGTDDEDGVNMGAMVPGLMGTVTIAASAAGFVDAWIDFSRDGDWNDAGEQIFNALPVAAGVFGYNFPVPPTAVAGNAVARFRFSDVGGLAYTGYYRKGEVEDYTLCIAPVPMLYARLLTNASLELRWLTCANYAYQLEAAANLPNWAVFSSPLAAPPGGGWMTNVVAATNAQQFFRLHVLTLTNSPVPSAPGDYSLYLTDGGIPRHYRLTIPAGYNAAVPAPLALIFHGHEQTADSFAALHPELAAYASARGVILVLPDGTDDERGTGWNIGDPTPAHPVNDVAFVLALIERLDATLNIDRKRVYAGGFSNGGQMCHWLAGRTTNVFAALAAISSGITGERDVPGVSATNPPPTGPISALIVNATNDCTRAFWGFTNDAGQIQASAFASAAHYTNANLCVSLPVFHTDYFVTNNGAIFRFSVCVPNGLVPMALVTNLVIREHYQISCAPGTEVLFVTLTDGGHNWPDANDNVGFDANREVLDFFLSHCNCAAPGAVETLVVPTAPGQYELKLCDQGYSRIFRLAIPAGYNPAVPTPIVFTFHGGRQTIQDFSTGHPALYDKCNFEGVILVLPQATIHPRTGATLWGNKPFDLVVDDVAFFTNLLEHLDATLNLNRKRVYACGFSNGGGLCHYLASTTTGLLAAIGPVCTQTGWNDPVTGLIPTPPAPLEPMPVLMVRGLLDPDRPFNGGPNTDMPPILCRSAADDTAYWTSADSCIGGPVVNSVLNVTTYSYPACTGTTEVILVAVGGMAHLWADAADGFNFDANVEVIDFLLRHARP